MNIYVFRFFSIFLYDFWYLFLFFGASRTMSISRSLLHYNVLMSCSVLLFAFQNSCRCLVSSLFLAYFGIGMLSSPRNPVGIFVGNFQKHKSAKEWEDREGPILAEFWKRESGCTIITKVAWTGNINPKLKWAKPRSNPTHTTHPPETWDWRTDDLKMEDRRLHWQNRFLPT